MTILGIWNQIRCNVLWTPNHSPTAKIIRIPLVFVYIVYVIFLLINQFFTKSLDFVRVRLISAYGFAAVEPSKDRPLRMFVSGFARLTRSQAARIRRRDGGALGKKYVNARPNSKTPVRNSRRDHIWKNTSDLDIIHSAPKVPLHASLTGIAPTLSQKVRTCPNARTCAGCNRIACALDGPGSGRPLLFDMRRQRR